jgi:hypothetical protein
MALLKEKRAGPSIHGFNSKDIHEGPGFVFFVYNGVLSNATSRNIFA